MKDKIVTKRTKAKRRAHRVRAQIRGTKAVPRLSVKRSLRYIHAQLIDDVAGVTLDSASDKKLKIKGKPIERAKAVGLALSESAKEKGITKVVFDRGSYRFHGRVAALADGAREGGLIF